jgi:AraC-like DNA-binding protein
MAKPTSRTRDASKFQRDFLDRIALDGHFLLALNNLSNCFFLVKDLAGRYVWTSDNLARRCGFATGAEMVGIYDSDFNPPRLVKKYRRDDLKVVRSGRPLLGLVELVVNDRGMPDWNVTNKFPLRDRRGKVVGLLATIQENPNMRDLPFFGDDLRAIVKHIYAHLSEPLRISELAAIAGVSCRQIERRFRSATGMSPTDFLIRARLDESCRRLHETAESIGKIAIDLGFYDQSVFTRMFRRHFCTTPSRFRQMRRTF